MHSGTVCVCIVQRMVSHSKCAGKKEKTVFKTKIDIIQLTAKIIYSHELRSSLIEEETLRTRLIQKVIKWKMHYNTHMNGKTVGRNSVCSLLSTIFSPHFSSQMYLIEFRWNRETARYLYGKINFIKCLWSHSICAQALAIKQNRQLTVIL